MPGDLPRRDFLKLSALGASLSQSGTPGFATLDLEPKLVSPGCRNSKVKVARIYLGGQGLWPRPDLDMNREVEFYKAQFEKLKGELADVEFMVDQLVTSVEQASALKERLKEVDGILIVHLRMGIWSMLHELLAVGKPTAIFAVPYSGHEWAGFGALQEQPLGQKLICFLTTDYGKLAAAIRPIRAIHHLREAKVLNVTTRFPEQYGEAVREKFGTEIKQIGLERMVDTYESIDQKAALAEAQRWLKGAKEVVEPNRAEIVKSCRMALAFQKLLDEEQATVMTVDCYGTMHKPLCQAYAYPCLGFVRLNNLGLGGICESDLASAMTHIIFQGLCGRPGFISDPTVDESTNSIILAHCLGTPKMDGPAGPAAPYKLRTIMERQEGVVPQVFMRKGQKVTQARLVNTERVVYFTGVITDTPDLPRGCRTKITVKIDGDAEKLWKNWSAGLHRSTCYGDISEELQHFCRFMDLELVNEAV